MAALRPDTPFGASVVTTCRRISTIATPETTEVMTGKRCHELFWASAASTSSEQNRRRGRYLRAQAKSRTVPFIPGTHSGNCLAHKLSDFSRRSDLYDFVRWHKTGCETHVYRLSQRRLLNLLATAKAQKKAFQYWHSRC